MLIGKVKSEQNFIIILRFSNITISTIFNVLIDFFLNGHGILKNEKKWCYNKNYFLVYHSHPTLKWDLHEYEDVNTRE